MRATPMRVAGPLPWLRPSASPDGSTALDINP